LELEVALTGPLCEAAALASAFALALAWPLPLEAAAAPVAAAAASEAPLVDALAEAVPLPIAWALPPPVLVLLVDDPVDALTDPLLAWLAVPCEEPSDEADPAPETPALAPELVPTDKPPAAWALELWN
jgi:hypothetical protein